MSLETWLEVPPSQHHFWRNNSQLLSPQRSVSLLVFVAKRPVVKWPPSLSRCLARSYSRCDTDHVPPSGHQCHKGQSLPSCVFFWQAAKETCFYISIVYKDRSSTAEQRWYGEYLSYSHFFYFYLSICFYCSGQAGESSVEIRWGVLGLWDTRLQGGEATAWTTQSPLITSPSQPRPSSNCLSMEPSCSLMSLVEFCNFRWWLQWTWL